MQGERLRSSDSIDELFEFRVLSVNVKHEMTIDILALFCDNHKIDAFNLRDVLVVTFICREEQNSLIVRISLLHSTLCCNIVTDVDQKS